MTHPRRRTQHCDLCGEPIKIDQYGHFKDEVGEFWDERRDDSVIAHAQCGLDAKLEMA